MAGMARGILCALNYGSPQSGCERSGRGAIFHLDLCVQISGAFDRARPPLRRL